MSPGAYPSPGAPWFTVVIPEAAWRRLTPLILQQVLHAVALCVQVPLSAGKVMREGHFVYTLPGSIKPAEAEPLHCCL